jgi:uncharacterized RDD family membrane protein YckC
LRCKNAAVSTTPDVVDLGGSENREDPTKVLVRRYLAYLVDFLLLLALGIGVLSTQAESNSIADFNERLEAVAADNGTSFTAIDENDLKRFDEEDGTYTIFTRDFPVAADNIVIVEQKDLQIAGFAVLAAWILMFVGLQGFTGATIGKAAAGLRAVRRDGSPPGIVRALGRSIFLPIDSLPSAPFLPLVGAISAVASKGNKRLGDFVGGTYVIDKDFKGQPVVLPGDGTAALPAELPAQPAPAAAAVPAWPAGGEAVVTTPAPAAPSDAPPWAQVPDATGQTPAWAAASGQPAPNDQIDWTSEQPLPGGTGDDPWAPGADGGAAGAGTAPSDWEAAIAAENLPQEPAASPGAAAAAAATAAVAGAGGPSIDDYEPQWDEARGSYIQWDPRRDEWLQYSETLKTWHPIDRPSS